MLKLDEFDSPSEGMRHHQPDYDAHCDFNQSVDWETHNAIYLVPRFADTDGELPWVRTASLGPHHFQKLEISSNRKK